jgi:hypothetical protein
LIAMTLHGLPPTKEDERTERVGQLLQLVDKALAQEAPDAARMQSALRDVRALLVEQLRTAPSSPSSVRKHARRAVALGGGLLVATIVWVAGVRHPEIVRNAQVVLVSTVWPGQAGPATEKVANAHDEEPLHPLERDRSEPDRIIRGARTHAKNRSLAKVTPRPAVGEGGAESAPHTTSTDVPASYLALAIRTAPSRPPSSDLSELLDRRK